MIQMLYVTIIDHNILYKTCLKTETYSQEFMVLRIFSVVPIFLDPLMDEFTLMEVF